MKYAIIVLVILGVCCGLLAYRLGFSNCRESVASAEIQTKSLVDKNNNEIREKVLSIPSDDNLQWLLNHYQRM